MFKISLFYLFLFVCICVYVYSDSKIDSAGLGLEIFFKSPLPHQYCQDTVCTEAINFILGLVTEPT